MGRLKQTVEPAVTTETTVALSPKLKKKVQVAVDLYHSLLDERDILNARIAKALEAVETPFHDEDEAELLDNGVKVNGVPVKMISGQKQRTLNKEKLMKKFKLTPKNLESVTDETDKKPYLYVGPRPKKAKKEE